MISGTCKSAVVNIKQKAWANKSSPRGREEGERPGATTP